MERYWGVHEEQMVMVLVCCIGQGWGPGATSLWCQLHAILAGPWVGLGGLTVRPAGETEI